MKKNIVIISIMVICLFTLNGCGKKSYPDLPNDAVAFEMGTFEDTEHDNALYGSIEYNGRVYILYGTINNSFKQDYADKCAGYIIQDKNSSFEVDLDNTDRRIYTLSKIPVIIF